MPINVTELDISEVLYFIPWYVCIKYLALYFKRLLARGIIFYHTILYLQDPGREFIRLKIYTATAEDFNLELIPALKGKTLK